MGESRSAEPTAQAGHGARLAEGLRRHSRLAQLLIWAGLTAVEAVVNAQTVSEDLVRRGIQVQPWEPWLWEITSGVVLVGLFPLLLGLDAWIAARRPGLGRWALMAAGLTLPFSLAHVLLMIGLRAASYMWLGQRYDFGPFLGNFLYEYRKDVLTFASVFALAQLWRTLGGEPAAKAAMPPVFRASSGRVQRLIPVDRVEWIEAQANYAALHVDGRPHLIRETLAELEGRLAASGFIRVHRGALVNLRYVTSVESPPRAVPIVRLASGQAVRLSASRKRALSEALRALEPELRGG